MELLCKADINRSWCHKYFWSSWAASIKRYNSLPLWYLAHCSVQPSICSDRYCIPSLLIAPDSNKNRDYCSKSFVFCLDEPKKTAHHPLPVENKLSSEFPMSVVSKTPTEVVLSSVTSILTSETSIKHTTSDQCIVFWRDIGTTES